MRLLHVRLILLAIPVFGRNIEKCFKYNHNFNNGTGTKFAYCLVFDASDPTKPRISEFKQTTLQGRQKIKGFERQSKANVQFYEGLLPSTFVIRIDGATIRALPFITNGKSRLAN